ncbi:hypothetical protein C1N81_04230 (plasmid) [Streptomyces sp. SGAir0957]
MTHQLIHAARAAQHRAARAASSIGAAHPHTRLLLAVASLTAAAAWEIGHHVTDLHTPNPQLRPLTLPRRGGALSR